MVLAMNNILTQIKKVDLDNPEALEDLDNPEALEEEILHILATQILSVESLSLLLNERPQTVLRRLQRLQKHHEVRVMTKRVVVFWGKVEVEKREAKGHD